MKVPMTAAMAMTDGKDRFINRETTAKPPTPRLFAKK
jgi:hypothetical protein